MKHKGWKIAFFTLLALVVAFFVWALSSPDEEENEIPQSEVLSSAIREQQSTVKGDGKDTVTILVYMNGSNLESDGGEATEDISEMIAAGYSDKVNIVIETLGTKEWDKKYNIASNRSQIYTISDGSLKLVNDNLGQLDCTEEETLENFVKWGVSNYPADRYILQFWNHGGGPVYGFGYDEWADDEYATLTIDEIQTALKNAGVFFDFIGMDCCLMSGLEVCCSLYDFCDYMILSEDFESGLGWEYTSWLKKLYENTSISTLDLGREICDSMVSANETEEWGDDSILAVVDESCMKLLFTAWTDFAYANEDTLTGNNYSRKVSRSIGGRVHPRLYRGFFSDFFNDYSDFYDYDDYGGYEDEEEEYDMVDYYVTDILSLSESVDTEESRALSAALAKALVYVKACGDDVNMTGLSVSLPYGDSDFYNELSSVFINSGINSDYVSWLGVFVDSDGYDDFFDYDDWDDEWSGWSDETYDEYYDYDWDSWDYYDDDYYYEDDYGYWDDWFDWDSWNYEDSYNYWFDDEYGDDFDYYDDWYDYDDYYYDDYYWDY